MYPEAVFIYQSHTDARRNQLTATKNQNVFSVTAPEFYDFFCHRSMSYFCIIPNSPGWFTCENNFFKSAHLLGDGLILTRKILFERPMTPLFCHGFIGNPAK